MAHRFRLKLLNGQEQLHRIKMKLSNCQAGGGGGGAPAGGAAATGAPSANSISNPNPAPTSAKNPKWVDKRKKKKIKSILDLYM